MTKQALDKPQIEAPEQVLPAALALHFRDQPLPTRVAVACGLGPDAVVGDLARPVTPRDGTGRIALRFFARRLLASRAPEAAAVRVFPGFVRPDRGALRAIWPKGRLQVLMRSGLLDDPQRRAALTYGDLCAMAGLGTDTVLQMGLAADALRSPWGETAAGPSEPAGPRAIAALRRMAAADWAQIVSAADPRFAHLIPGNGESLATIAAALAASVQETGRAAVSDGSGGLIDGPVSLPAWTSRIESEVSRLKSLTLEQSLAEILEVCTDLQKDRHPALLARLGWSGPQLPLIEAGRLLKVTRERLRQIEEQVRSDLPATPVYVPALARALEALDAAAPIEADQAAALLRERGIAHGAFLPDSVIAAAADLHMPTSLTVLEAPGFRVVARRGDVLTAEILSCARRVTGYTGMGHVEDVIAEVAARGDVPCQAEDVRRALAASPRFRMLTGAWYRATDVAGRRDGVVNVCLDMLSVTPVLAVAQLWEGVRQWYTPRSTTNDTQTYRRVPPVEVLRAFLQAHPDFAVDPGDRARARHALDFRTRLEPAPRALVEALRAAPAGMLDRAALISECASRGVSVQMVRRELTYNGIFVQAGRNAWCLRDAQPGPDAAQGADEAAASLPQQLPLF